ncbi:PIN domain nuclease [Devosia sp. LjRoot16]|uniref:type II toxin-antitoxin system VapC family toxin n=1 Tax=Devosia sp. LjRoot16 TaxID=3342271 RepID=UPI003ECECA20
MIVADSSVWIANLRGEDTPPTRFLRAVQVENDLLIGDLIVLEILQGVRNERQAAGYEASFLDHGMVPMLDEAVALASARNFRELRRKGISVRKTTDLIIATFCMVHGHHLLHQDRDFDHFETLLGLKVFRPH